MDDITLFIGTYDLEEEVNVNEYLKEIGSSFMERKHLNTLKPTIIFSVSPGDNFAIIINQPGSPKLKIEAKSSWTFQPGQPFEADFFGLETKTTYVAHIEGEKIVSKNVVNDANTISMEMVYQRMFTIEFSMGSIKAKRIFRKTGGTK
jgi:hypothetical protein